MDSGKIKHNIEVNKEVDFTNIKFCFFKLHTKTAYTKAEQAQLDLGLRSIRVSPSYYKVPFFKRALKDELIIEYNRAFISLDTPYISSMFDYFRMQVRMYVSLNYGKFKTELNAKLEDLVFGMIYLYGRDYLGGSRNIRPCEKTMIKDMVIREMSLIDKYGLKWYVNRLREMYSNQFVDNKAHFRCVKYDKYCGKRPQDLSRRQRTATRVSIVINFVRSILKSKKRRFVDTKKKCMKQSFYDEVNSRWVKAGFCALKRSTLFKWVQDAIALMGLTREEIISNILDKGENVITTYKIMEQLISKTVSSEIFNYERQFFALLSKAERRYRWLSTRWATDKGIYVQN